ncbi:hypothetical protein GMORB2_3579 [Geosmithia morbida]|uniref:Uncharacterized protein n=1 Tax=Geosmithia morbida TaxID=1094350 RepID=A0A9P4YQR5_9HYPO|nr:uncharacterized protein GMORB2_3579 [Geosmithia morbida]KAF4119891.1 hypothetical protein GMORB2_3579 [Geosmithia morbida]
MKFSVSLSTLVMAVAASAAKCPAPGETNNLGYGCNPAHTYPDGQTCQLVDGCNILEQAAKVAAAAACPALGETNDLGYGCNPAHTYPDGQVCQLIDGCNVIPPSS